MKLNLVIVDFQYDFANPNGSLYVPGAEEAKNAILTFITEHCLDINQIMFTRDYHPANHCSFKENGGQWPKHCVQDTEGCCIDTDLMVACKKYNIPYIFIDKGQHHRYEEYSAFATPGNRLKLQSLNSLYVVCGLAGDYCVMSTYLDIIKADRGNYNAVIFKNGCASIDSSEFEKQLKNNKVLTI